jgi:acetolactate synthase-1/2/3 large subunit
MLRWRISMNGAECLLRTLVANGIEVCFMNPGTSEMQFVSALESAPELRGVLCLFEGVCSGAADGYARMTGRPAATLLHLGPGLANGLSNFHNARKAHSPIVSIVGEHATHHLRFDAPLTSDIQAFARTVSSEVRYLQSAEEMGQVAADAIAAAVRPPGHVSTIIVPADFSWSPAGEAGPTVPRPTRPRIASACIDEARQLILDGGETVGVLLGGSGLYTQGLEAASRIAASTGARFFAARNEGRLASGRGRFQPVRVPYFPEKATAALAGLKHLVLVEAAAPVSFFGYPDGRSWLAPDGCEIHTLAKSGDDGSAALLELASGFGATGEDTDVERASEPADGPLTLDALGQCLASMLPDDAIVCDEMISSGEAIGPHLLRAAAHDYLPVTGGSIGQGLPVATGAAIACPGRKVVALEGDGSAMYALQALWTMARERLDVITVIFANRSYRILEVEMRRTGASAPKTGPAADMIDISRPELDFVRLSEGMGVPARKTKSTSDFISTFEHALRNAGPFLIEADLAS